MTDLPDPAAENAAAAATPEGGAPSVGDPELAALVRPRSPAPGEGDASLAALVKLGQRPVSAAIPPPVVPGQPEPAAAEPAASADAVAPGPPPADVRAASVVALTVATGTDEAGPSLADPPTPDASASTAGDETAVAVDLPVAAAVAEPPADLVDAPASRRRSIALRFTFAFLLGVILVVGVGAGALYAWGSQYDGRVLPGVHVGSTDLSGLTREQAEAAIARAYASLGTGKIVLAGPDGQVTISYADIARGPDTAAILGAALAAGRQGEPIANLIGEPQAAIHGVTVASAVTYDRAKLAATVDVLAAKIDHAPTDASVAVAADGSFAVSAATVGRAVDKAALLARLDQKLTALDAPAEISLDIPVNAVSPAFQTASADDAKAAADRMAADLVITRRTDSWTIPSASLRPLISFAPASDGSITPVLDEAGLDPLLQALAMQVNQTVQDARLELDGGHVVASGSSREGRSLDVPAMKTAIVDQLAARQAGTAVEPMAAAVTAVQPKLSSELAATYAAQMKPISSYSIYYWVLINNHWGGNIEGPARKINGTVIPAGGTFDFWKVVGDLHQIPGVGPGNAIEGGKITVTGAFGGGICTTSTTLFNAALEAGMKLGARQNHNEFISRYPAGLDATVWIVGSAEQTMSFTNDTPYPILIQSVVQATGSKRWLTFKIWSVPNGRTYEISNRIIQPGPSAVDTVVEDPTKPVGWSYRVNTPVDGAKVWVTVTIYDHGTLHWSKTYFSNYPAVNGVLQVGTKPVP